MKVSFPYNGYGRPPKFKSTIWNQVHC
jgi:hypothetical protein